MKKLIILGGAMLMGILPCFGQGEPKMRPPLTFEVTEWDFGEIREEDGEVGHTFGFSNQSSVPIAIDRAVSSCGCTTPEYPRRPVSPGEREEITVVFDPVGYPGEFTKTVSVVSGGGKFTNFLTIKGRVIPRAKSVEDEYPYEAGGGVRLDNTLAAFRTIAQGGSAAVVVKWVNTGPKAVSFALEPVESSGLLGIFAPEMLCAGCRGDITLVYDLSDKTAYGAAYDVLRPVVDGTPSATTVYCAMTGIDDFDGMDADSAQRLALDGQFLDLGEIRRRTIPYTRRLVAVNGGGKELHIRSVGETTGFKTTLRAGMTIAPGASLPFEAVLYSDKYHAGALSESIILVVDDPVRPVREIRVTAKIK